MSTDVANTATMAPTAAMMVPVTTDAMARLAEWVTAASQAHQLVAPLIDSAFVPSNFKPSVAPNASEEDRQRAREVAIANGTSAVLLGLNLGLDPLTALQQIILIKNRPSMYAKAKVAILTSHGYDIWVKELDDEKAVVCVVRPTTGGRVEEFEVTMAMAKKAGWTSNDNYSKTPQDMLYARAAGRACDRTGAHILMGLSTAEDLDTIEVEAAVGPRINAARVTAAEILGTVEAPPRVEAKPEPVEAAGGGITASQQKMLHPLLSAAGRSDRDVALVWMSGVIGREIQTTKELTKREATKIIDTLLADTVESPQTADVPS